MVETATISRHSEMKKICRGKYHVSQKSRTPKRFCDVCNSYVNESCITKKRKNCPCCNGITTKKKDHGMAKAILNKATLESKHIIESYNLMPTNNEVYCVIFVKYNHFTYSVPLQILARYCEAFQNHTTGNHDELWSEQMRDDCSFSCILKYCEKRIKFVGLR